MNNQAQKTLFSVQWVGLLGLLGLFGFFASNQDTQFASSNPVTSFSKELAAPMTSTDTEFTLGDVLDLRNNAIATSTLATTTYFMIEPDSEDNAEIVMCRKNGYDQLNKKFANCERGLAFTGASETSVSANKKSHPAGSIVIMSNVGQFFNLYASIWENEIIYGDWTLATTTEPTSTKLKLFFTTQNGDNYIWYDPVTDQMGYATGTSEFAFQSGGVTFTAIQPLTLISGELKFASSTYSFDFDSANNFDLATSTIASGTASGTALDDLWNSRWNATSTRPSIFTFSDGFQSNASSTINGDFKINGNTTSTGSMHYTELCDANNNCVTTAGGGIIATSTHTFAMGNGTTAEGVGVNITIPGNTIGSVDGGGIFAKTYIDDLDTNGADTVIIRVKYGGTTLFTSETISVDDYHGYIETLILSQGTVSTQEASTKFRLSPISNGLDVANQWREYEVATSTVDSTSDQQYQITFQWSGNDNYVDFVHSIIQILNN